MKARTYYVAENDAELIASLIEIRKGENISQSELAEMIGSKQQAISRLERNEHSPSLKLFYSVLNALGYELQIVKKKSTISNTQEYLYIFSEFVEHALRL